MKKKKFATENLDFDVSTIKSSSGELNDNLGCAIAIENWLTNLYSVCKKSQRALPYLEKAIDLVYSEVEAELYRTSGGKASAYSAAEVAKHPVWDFFVQRVTKRYGGLVRIVKPHRSPTESVRSKLINRTFSQMLYNKNRVLERSSNSILASGELGVLKVELLDAQVGALVDAYNGHLKQNDELWPALNELFQKHVGTSSKAEGSVKEGGPEIDIAGDVFAEYKFAYEKVWDFGKMRNKINLAMEVGARAGFKGNTHAKFGQGGSAGFRDKKVGEEAGRKLASTKYTEDYTPGKGVDVNKKEDASDDSFETMQLIPGIDLEVNVSLAAQAGLRLKFEHELTIGDFMEMKNEADLFAGASVKAEFVATANTANYFASDEIIKFKAGASAFAGVKATGSSSISFKARGIKMAGASVTGSVSAGIGVSAAVETIVKSSGDISFKAGAGATVGVGSSVDFGTMVNPMLVKILLWDKLGHRLHTQQTKRITNIQYNRQVNQIAVSRCQDNIRTAMTNLDLEYRTLAEELWRIPTFTNVSTQNEVTTIHDEISRPNQHVLDQYLKTLGVTDHLHMNDDDVLQAAIDIDNDAREVQANAKREKEAKKAFSKKGKRLKRANAIRRKAGQSPAGLLAVQPHTA
ncbi:hypothetical protein [Vibrio brasiliensis]|uniref:hypothetical protein n=1 Tax=Vibrio brasiliensis TaxID=170652 RepID=UPI001EFDF2AF|nr:hypothetical protein [Vibrio brasiliensis]MCG9727396.1 hypothetical protein [Vibrio brasiliensis]